MATESKPVPLASNVPDWVQAELLVDVLRESVKGFSKIKSFKADSGSAAGENYATIMLRLNIEVELEDGKEKSVSYMLKLPHQVEVYKKMMEGNNIFATEFAMYKTIVPELEQIYRDAGVEVKFGAKAYELKGAKSDYILLEDLAPRGFKNTNRTEGLDQEHTECALKRLSMWHAASAMRVATKGAYPENLTVGFFKEELRPMLAEMNNSLAKNFLSSVKMYEGNEDYIEKLKALEPNITDQIFKMAKVDHNNFNVLNHGDFWSNNMMFSHDAFGQIKDICLVDFQIPKWGVVAQDLYYFLLSSTKLEDKLTKFDHYIKFYHDSLVENLKTLKYPKTPPTLRELHMTLYKYGFWGYLTATGVMSAVLVDPTETASFENFLSDSTEGTDFKTLLYTNPRYRKHMQAILPWLLNRGAIEGF
ncbi:uncharacterized protein [Drosophila virilis]|uniref:CHK kinase-like domain-containing protein n=1 Tax=Drosophila virilis TaxID=7244 RepID=B4LX66_DROVI|nr:uncharacterized protein LOC6630491 [Drosophila virilis]EDW66718.1 uncharacterized protein Dvir_GJ23755 [Drosophila virilis]